MIKAISDLKLPTDLIDIIEDYVIDLRDNSVDYAVSSGINTIICVCPHSRLNPDVFDTNGRPNLSHVVPLYIRRDWSHTYIDLRKRTAVSQAFVYQYIHHNPIHTLVKYMKRNYDGDTYTIKINGEDFIMPISLYNKLCSWIMDDHFINRMHNVRDDLPAFYQYPVMFKKWAEEESDAEQNNT